MNPRKFIPGLIAWLLLCFAAASLGAFFMPGEWYAALRKPAWNPPAWIFGPVWTALYTIMAVAAWLVWKHGGFAAFRQVHRPAAWLLALYLAWVGFAAVLNGTLWRLN
jgi:benzodiazapine receptor